MALWGSLVSMASVRSKIGERKQEASMWVPGTPQEVPPELMPCCVCAFLAGSVLSAASQGWKGRRKQLLLPAVSVASLQGHRSFSFVSFIPCPPVTPPSADHTDVPCHVPLLPTVSCRTFRKGCSWRLPYGRTLGLEGLPSVFLLSSQQAPGPAGTGH